MKMAVRCLALFLALGAACSPSRFEAEGDQPTREAREIEAEVWSPYCPGRLLIDCTTTQARELRADIERRLTKEATKDEVLEWIRRDFGDEAIARPSATGAGLVIWLVPAAIFLAGALVVARVVRSWRKQSTRVR